MSISIDAADILFHLAQLTKSDFLNGNLMVRSIQPAIGNVFKSSYGDLLESRRKSPVCVDGSVNGACVKKDKIGVW